MNRRQLLYATLVATVALFAVPSAFAQTTYALTRTFTVTNRSTSGSVTLGGIAVDSSGNLFVAAYDPIGASICKFSASGSLVARFGTSEGNSSPNYLAVDSNGNVFRSVLSHGTPSTNTTIFKYSNNGVLLSNSSPRWPGYTSITCDAMNNILVSHCFDQMSPQINTVKKFSNNLTLLSQFSSSYLYNNYSPAQVFGTVADTNGNVFVTVNSKPGIIKFDAQGNYVTTYDAALSRMGLAIDGSGKMYSVTNSGFVILNSNGTTFASFPVAIAGYSQVAVLTDGSKVFVTNDTSDSVFEYTRQ